MRSSSTSGSESHGSHSSRRDSSSSEAMKIVALVSGGKDSCFAMMESVRYGHEIVCLAHLHPPAHLSPEQQEIDSFMYQSVGHNVVQLIAESMDKPLVTETISGKAIKTDIDYTTTTEGDEVEDLHRLLEKVLVQFPDVQGVCTGAIFSSYQRNRVENVCSRLGLTSLGYLWRRNQEELLSDMVDSGIEAILVKVAAIGLSPRKHLGRTIADLQMELLGLQEKYELNVCGEGGEYETLTLDCPLFKKRIIVDSSRVVLHSDDYFAPVAFIVVEACHLEDKEAVDDDALRPYSPVFPRFVPQDSTASVSSPSPTTALAGSTFNGLTVPAIGSFRNQYFLSGVMSQRSSELSLEEEMKEVFLQATATLAQHDMTLEDASFVHLYVRDMSDFGKINAEYCKYFGQYMPPSRSCVELNSMPARVLLDCFAIKRSGVAKLEKPRSAMRDVLHIKSISAWAPNCIGPYSQANILHKSLILLAGQIAFQPQTMEIIGKDHLEQTHQSLRNAANVFDALDSNLRHVSCAVVYVTASPDGSKATDAVATESRRLLISNAGLQDSFENAYNSEESDEAVDKAEAIVALATHTPLLVIQLSHLPRHALVEAELQALTHGPVKYLKPASKTLDVVDVNEWRILAQTSAITRSLCHIVCTAQSLTADKPLQTACVGLLLAVEKAFESADMPWDRLCHIRVFYVPHESTPSEQVIAQEIHEVLAKGVKSGLLSSPALTFVPVEAIQNDARIAFQITVQDLDRLETDLWLRKQA